MGYRFIEVDQDVVDATRSDWERQIEQSDFDFPPWRFLQQLDSAQKWLNGPVDVAGLGSVHWRAVVPEGNGMAACALVEISFARTAKADPQARLKMLNLRLSPELDSAGDASSASLLRVRDALTTLFEGILGMTEQQTPADIIKIFSERDADAGFFEMVAINLNQAENGVSLDVSRHGRWVELRLQ
ncbi:MULTISPECIES: hypothetical protein [unclassified Thioalkalivibrio]|uniref:hypothetical protein n=1 Tax=unclassified Thioalkalivibrio TaxID=2621013 RepID=UPI000373FE34|nr:MULTISPECIES: hypothetical protein [unclassified Thioalkalivibrio]